MTQKNQQRFRNILGPVFLSASLLTGGCATTGKTVSPPPQTQKKSAEQQEFNEQVAVFAYSLGMARNRALTNPSYKELTETALKAMIGSIDPHSAYLPAKERSNLRELYKGSFAGIGVSLSLDESGVKIVDIVEDGPADKAGIKANDVITKINDAVIAGMDLETAVNLLRGDAGSAAQLEIQRQNTPAPLQVAVTRAVIEVKTVHKEKIGEDIGYLRITSFGGKTSRDVESAFKEWKKDPANAGINSYVIDLRNNLGGFLDQALRISDAFLETGEITTLQSTNKKEVFMASPGDITDGKPVVILINGLSASASEVVTGALQDHGRVTVIGTTSFGKGIVQDTFDLKAIIPGREDAIQMTTRHYLTPSGRSIQGIGITPDILAIDPEEDRENQGQEAKLKGAIANPHSTDALKDTTRPTAQCVANDNPPASDLAKPFLRASGKPDDQLLCAVEYLRKEQKYKKVVKGP